MEIGLCNGQGKTLRKTDEVFTKFKFQKNTVESLFVALIKSEGVDPLSESNRFTHFLVKGDHLNGDKRVRKYRDVIEVICGN